eukprot:TRINITY_DN934_c0_g1_i4.p1 TRINITY_DN934_c0_g1~~TRINITY_DN934_c0_g1_i4.p1  ORF type:complete len:222 (-),score=47.82 TRINITY_DN934_c0_g1_i4:142-717(-)
MLVPKATRKAVYRYLLSEGVCVAHKDLHIPKHDKIHVPNLYVVKLMQSLKSRKYVTEQFNWQYFYWYITNEGIEYLRGYLGLPDEVVPATLKKPRPAPRPAGSQGDRRPERRSAPGTAPEGEKKVGPGADFQPGFRGAGRGARPEGPRFGGDRTGFGRGAPRREGYRHNEGGAGGRPGFSSSPATGTNTAE